MQAFELSDLVSQLSQSDKLYLEFLRVPTLSVGVYILPANGTDPQQPHTEDEVYYVVQGQGFIRVENEDREVKSGSVIFVKAHAEHRFHTISQALTILVFFAPAEYSLGENAVK
jgi:mannose-6-phosphate isomerase-like protein (cupin superfamily)